MAGILVLSFCLLVGVSSVNAAGKWSYVGKTGPLHWHEIFPHACSGDNQSPIDIKPEETLYHEGLKDFAIWYDPPRPDAKMYIKNTGYTAQVDLKGDFFITNGGLGHVYKAFQFHFHWGHKSHQGSEHLVEGQASPIELHIVSYNQDRFNDITEAVTTQGGLAVLGVLFKLSKEDNPAFDYIIRGMRQIRNPDKVAKIELPLFSLRDLLPGDIQRYYRYNGSLTTPGCFETVTWTVFDQMQTISHYQMDQFRKLLQYKRKDEDQQTSRPKRELTKEEKKMEHNAKQVLDELGIKGKDSSFERKVLKQELVNSAEIKRSDQGQETTAEGVKQVPGYVQDNIVNNFRPAQPINSRIVYRSFKLKNYFTVDAKVGAASYKAVDDHKCSATALYTSVSLIIVTVLVALF